VLVCCLNPWISELQQARDSKAAWLRWRLGGCLNLLLLLCSSQLIWSSCGRDMVAARPLPIHQG
jgi:hypothetical protein